MLAASPEEIEKKMNAMEEQGIICGYPTLINWDKTGCEHVTALIEVTVAPSVDADLIRSRSAFTSLMR